MMGIRDIIQIIPTDDWHATFKEDDNSTSKRPLICWAFCKKEDGYAGLLGWFKRLVM